MRARQKDAKEKYNIGPGHYHPSIERFQPQSPSFRFAFDDLAS